MTKNRIINFLSSHKREIESRFKVSKIGLFGSYATNEHTNSSDIDIIVSMPSDFDLYYDLKNYLETAFNKSVDLGLEKNLRELVRRHIKNEVLYV
ncbi:MAG: nucleotidyltransferase domain-containing protein [Kiritimatiellae bacterium]|nr:nucleotidyltransferase domain-containing protein [Kiritimatiellia bacterium]